MSDTAPTTTPATPNLNYASELTPEIEAIIKERFTYKQWTPDQVAFGDAVTHGAIEWAKVIVKNVPPSPTRTRVINLIEEARMLANAAITYGGKF